MVTNEERERKYADAITVGYAPEHRAMMARWFGDEVAAVMAVADAEQDELRAALLRVRALADAFADDGLSRHGGNIAWHIEEAIANEKGDFPDAADQRIASQRARAEAAEAKVARVEAALRDFRNHADWCQAVGHAGCCQGECDCHVSTFRAALDGDA